MTVMNTFRLSSIAAGLALALVVITPVTASSDTVTTAPSSAPLAPTTPTLRMPAPSTTPNASATPAPDATAPSRLAVPQGPSLLSAPDTLKQDIGRGPIDGSRLQIVGGRGDSTRGSTDADRLLQQPLRPDNKLDNQDVFTGLKLSVPLN